MTTIQRQDPVQLSQDWGAKFQDYKIDAAPVDFQDLMVAVSEKRAVTVEGEVAPLTTRIKNRNKQLDDLGKVLADLSNLQAQFKSDEGGWTRHDELSDDSYAILCRLFPGQVNFSVMAMAKCEVEEWIQRVKSRIDGLNNEAQTDMTRLQGLVDRRDESFSTATNLMSAISDTRSNLIRNL